MPRRGLRSDRPVTPPQPPDEVSEVSARAGIAPALKAGFRATTSRVQEMHHAIAGKTFGALQQLPLVSAPAALVKAVHDTITDGVYAAVREGGGAALTLAGSAASKMGSSPPASRRESSWRSALSGVFGDSLHAAGNPLAVTMGFHAAGRALPLTSDALAGLQPRVALFIHGLACDEHSWSRTAEVWGPLHDAVGRSYGERLQNELGWSAIYLRYNSGLAVADNARQLALQLAQLVEAAPQLRELVLIGHSMGGLVARSACEQGAASGLAWTDRVRVLICLGTPHLGAPLEKLGELATLALGLSSVTRPLARIAQARSRGIKDLRHGLPATQQVPLAMPLRLIAGSFAGEAASAVLGDGLVMPHSAADTGSGGDVERVELRGLGHMDLLNHPRVYTLIRRWLLATPPR